MIFCADSVFSSFFGEAGGVGITFFTDSAPIGGFSTDLTSAGDAAPASAFFASLAGAAF
jgi:hypothetical protein